LLRLASKPIPQHQSKSRAGKNLVKRLVIRESTVWVIAHLQILVLT
jgi:hypothetical protein